MGQLDRGLGMALFTVVNVIVRAAQLNIASVELAPLSLTIG